MSYLEIPDNSRVTLMLLSQALNKEIKGLNV